MKKRIISFVLSVSLMLSLLPISSLAAGSMPFTDVAEKDWFYDAVEYVYENGMMSGTGNNKFSPNTTTTRGMIVTILHRMEGTPTAAGAAFSDVPEGQWYTAAVAWASANSIVNGYGNDKFGPNDTITREQMAAILYRYSQYKGYDTTASDNLSGFSDAAKVSTYAADAMGWAVGSGLISGFSGNTLMPRGSATRAQVATILMRFCEKIALPSGKTYTVTFDYNYDSKGTYTSVKVQEGKPVESPADPIRSGYSFGGWFTASSGGSKFDFDALITGDITLYAQWVEPLSSFTPSEDADRYFSSTLYFDVSDETHVKTNNGIRYYDNEIYLFVVPGTTQKQVEQMISSDVGYIVGKDGYAGSYLIRFENAKEYDALKTLVSQYEQYAIVDTAYLNYAMELDTAAVPSYTSDIWPASLWDFNHPSGGNWGLEAIQAPASWTLYDHMQSVSVGVFDGGCDVTHKDLKNVIVASSLAETKKHRIDHGTHVSGIIAATFGDNYGVCGVSPTAKLSVIDASAADTSIVSGFNYCTAYSWLIAEQKCKVINMSLAFDNAHSKAATANNQSAREEITYLSDQIAQTLRSLRAKNYDFTIVVGAGNGNNSIFYKSTQSSIGYYEKCEDPDHQHSTEYYIDQDDNNTCKPCTQEMLRNQVTGGVDAKWGSPITRIEDADLMSRIIVVGSCGQNDSGNYSYSDFSNTGTRIDVVAPGEQIESSISNNSFQLADGTSMAAPHVTGVAAMIYAVNPELSGDQVKRIIEETANINVTGCSYQMVNAFDAVLQAYSESLADTLTLKGEIINQGTGLALANATVKVVNRSGQTVKQVETNSTGEFTIDGLYTDYSSDNIFWDTYSVEIEKSGYAKEIILQRATLIIDNVFDLGKIELTPIKSDVSGIVVDKDTMQPIAGAAVRYGSEMYPNEIETVTTDSAGRFTFTGKTVADDWWFLSVEGTDDYSYRRSDNPTAEGENTTAGFCGYLYVVKNDCMINGLVRDTEGNLVMDAYVSIEDSGLFFSRSTDAAGLFYCWAPPGEYTVSVSKDGYLSYETSITVSSGDIGSVEVTLNKK